MDCALNMLGTSVVQFRGRNRVFPSGLAAGRQLPLLCLCFPIEAQSLSSEALNYSWLYPNAIESNGLVSESQHFVVK